MLGNERLFVISNRLPLSISKDCKDKWNFKLSSGGLVAALSGMKNKMSFIWFGWPGSDYCDDEKEALKKELWVQQKCVPVYISDETADLYYNGFANEVLWPLFHYIVDQNPFEAKYFQAYKQANKLFAEEIIKYYQEGDLIWVHDYHLMLLPRYLKKRLPEAKIGFFLHIPFPTSEIFRTLPVRESLLRGVLCSDLIGFHTPDYLNHFSSSCIQILGCQTTPTTVLFNARCVTLGIFPVGIEPDKFLDGIQNIAVKKELAALKKSFGVDEGKKVILGVDRLDYIKGIPNKLIAFEEFCSMYPEWKDKVTMIQIAVPSRTDVPEYKKLMKEVNEIYGRVNGLYGSLHHFPLMYLNQSVNFTQLCALYALADAMLITSIRDGMNLVCYEYVTAQRDRNEKGVLILSEFAGASHSLSGSISINPHNIKSVAMAMHEALTMNAKDKNMKHKRLFDYVTYQTSGRWGETFVRALAETTPNTLQKPLQRLDVKVVLDAFKSSKRRLIVLDDDGTLKPLSGDYLFERPSSAVLASLRTIAQSDNTDVLIISGRSKRILQSWFESVNASIAAEYGCFFRQAGSRNWERRIPDDFNEKQMMSVAMPICVSFSERTPGSLVEEKETSIAWHYRSANPYFSKWQARDFDLHLTPFISRLGAEIVPGDNGILSIRPRGAGKGATLKKFVESIADTPPNSPTQSASNGNSCPSPPKSPKGLPEKFRTSGGNLQPIVMPYDFILCMGDDREDEDMFTAVKEMLPHDTESSNGSKVKCFCVAVGKKNSAADYWVDRADNVRRLLVTLALGQMLHHPAQTITPS